MKKVEYVCKKCGSGDLYFSLSERRNTIFEVKDGIVKKRDTAYPDDREINYVRCSKCGAEIEIDEDTFDEILRKAQDLL